MQIVSHADGSEEVLCSFFPLNLGRPVCANGKQTVLLIQPVSAVVRLRNCCEDHLHISHRCLRLLNPAVEIPSDISPKGFVVQKYKYVEHRRRKFSSSCS